MSKVLIVGSGLTGSAAKHFLSNSYNGITNAPLISIWEGNEVSGGRMQTNYLNKMQGSDRCDLGAQYISQNVNGLEEHDVYEFLNNINTFKLIEKNSLIEGMRPEHQQGHHYIAPLGTSSIMTSFSGSDVQYGKRLTELAVSQTDNTFLAFSDASTVAEAFDVVVLTMPAPQVVQVLQNTQQRGSKLVSTELLERLQRVKYSSRFALAAYYQLPSLLAKQEFLDSVSWRAKYIMDDDVVRYVSIENFKYEETGHVDNSDNSDNGDSGTRVGIDGTQASDNAHIVSVLVHTSVPYGLANADVLRYCSLQSDTPTPNTELEQRKQDVTDTILQHLTRHALPALAPFPPLHTKLVGWVQSQVSQGYYNATVAKAVGANTADTSRGVLKQVEEEGYAPPAVLLTVRSGSDIGNGLNSSSDSDLVVITDSEYTTKTVASPLLVLAGDAFTESNFDGCIKSAKYAAAAISKHVVLV